MEQLRVLALAFIVRFIPNYRLSIKKKTVQVYSFIVRFTVETVKRMLMLALVRTIYRCFAFS